jgi:hypothetical protein
MISYQSLKNKQILKKQYKLACPIRCASCINASYCTTCIGVQLQNNSRNESNSCACPAGYFENLTLTPDCIGKKRNLIFFI